MSKKTEAAKRDRARKHYRRPRNSKTPNPARTTMLSNAALVECVESLAFGQLGCALIRAIGIKPIDLLTAPVNDQEDQEATS